MRGTAADSLRCGYGKVSVAPDENSGVAGSVSGTADTTPSQLCPVNDIGTPGAWAATHVGSAA